MEDNIIQFEPIKNLKELDNKYIEYIDYLDDYFGTKITMENLFKRLYYTIRYLEGTVNACMIVSELNLSEIECKRGKKYLIEWLENIIKKLKEGV